MEVRVFSTAPSKKNSFLCCCAPLTKAQQDRKEVIEILSLFFLDKNIAIHLEYPEDIPVIIDLERIEQVLKSGG